MKNETDVVLRLSSNMIGNSHDETNFPYTLLLTNRKVTTLPKAFDNSTPTNIFSKAQLSNSMQLGGFLGRLLGPLLRTGLPLIKSVIQPLAKSVLIPVGLRAAESAPNPGIHKKNLGSGHNTNLIISNKGMKDILEIDLLKILDYY